MKLLVEVGHIYGFKSWDEFCDLDTENGAQSILNACEKFNTKFQSNNNHYETIPVLMIDDIHVDSDVTRDVIMDHIPNIVKLYERNGVNLQAIWFESDFIKCARSLIEQAEQRCSMVINSFDKGTRMQAGIMVDNKFIALVDNNRPTCAALSAAWRCLFDFDFNFPDDMSPEPVWGSYDRDTRIGIMVSILDDSHHNVERKVDDILKHLDINICDHFFTTTDPI